MTLKMSVQQELDQERITADRTRERLVVRGHVSRQLGVGGEALAAEQAAERSGHAEVVHSDVQVPFHLRVEDGRAPTAPVHLALVAVFHREVNLDVHLSIHAATLNYYSAIVARNAHGRNQEFASE